MPIISVRDNENNRWKKNAKKKQQQQNKSKTNKNRKEEQRTEAMVEGWELNYFVVHLS